MGRIFPQLGKPPPRQETHPHPSHQVRTVPDVCREPQMTWLPSSLGHDKEIICLSTQLKYGVTIYTTTPASCWRPQGGITILTQRPYSLGNGLRGQRSVTERQRILQYSHHSSSSLSPETPGERTQPLRSCLQADSDVRSQPKVANLCVPQLGFIVRFLSKQRTCEIIRLRPHLYSHDGDPRSSDREPGLLGKADRFLSSLACQQQSWKWITKRDTKQRR